MEEEFLKEYEGIKKIIDKNKNESKEVLAINIKQNFGLDDVSDELIFKWLDKWQKKYDYQIINFEESEFKENEFINFTPNNIFKINLNKSYKSSGKETAMVRINKKLYDEIKSICDSEGIQYHILLNSIVNSVLEQGIIIKRDDITYKRKKS